MPSFDTIIAFFTSLDPVWFVGLMFASAFFADFVRMVRYSKADELERRARAEDSTLSQVTSVGAFARKTLTVAEIRERSKLVDSSGRRCTTCDDPQKCYDQNFCDRRWREGRAEPVVHPGGRFTGLDIG